MGKIISKLKDSTLFFKIILVFLSGYFLFASAMYQLRDYFFDNFHAKSIHNTAINYSNLIIEKIGTPPDTTLARKYADELIINVRIKTKDFEWAYNNKTRHFDGLELKPFEVRHNTLVGFDDGLHVITEREDAKYLISVHRDEYDYKFYDHIFLAIALTWFSIILYIMYRIVKRILNPITQLREGVKKVSKGDFENEIKTNRTDELGKLVNSFNIMNHEVRSMIKARDQLLLDVSHELRTPITRVKLALEFMDESTSKKNIQDDIKEIETMVAELLETERLSSVHGGIKKEPVHINELLEEITISSAYRNPGVEINASEQYTLMGDSDRLKTLFRNIIDNALKYSGNQDKPVEIDLKEKDNRLLITIKDSGNGIPEDEIPYIFEPFYRVDKSRSKETGGYGLGMHLSKKIIDAHKGTIEVSSELGKGTTCILSFLIS